MDFIRLVSSNLADEELPNETGTSRSNKYHTEQSHCKSNNNKKAFQSLGSLLSSFLVKGNINDVEEEDTTCTTDSYFDEIVHQLKEDEALIQQKVKEKMENDSNRTDGALGKENGSGAFFPENFLTQAARKASPGPPLIRIDEWNHSSKKWHNHGVLPMDEETRSIMNGRCRTLASKISDVLNNSTLSSYSDDVTPEIKRDLERSTSRSLLLTFSQDSIGEEVSKAKKFVVTFEDDRKITEEANNLPDRSLRSINLPSRRFSARNRTVSVKEIEFY